MQDRKSLHHKSTHVFCHDFLMSAPSSSQIICFDRIVLVIVFALHSLCMVCPLLFV
jgi:hypothetical protein